MVDFQKLGEWLNECTNEQLIIRIGRYTGDYYIGNEEFKRITGDLFVMTNAHNIFRVVSDDSSIVDDFDVIGSDAIITPIDKELENTPISYSELDVSNKESLRRYFPKDEVGNEMFECVQSVPVQFRQDAIDTFDCYFDKDGIVEETWNLHNVDKTWTYFLEDMIAEMTDEEREKYGF